MDAGTHIIFIGEIVGAEALQDAPPMSYACYQQVKRGTAPPVAPTFIQQSKRKEDDKNMTKYECSVCGYVYDPAKGDPEHAIALGTAFEGLPDDWVCPVCGSSKSEFSKSS